MGKKDKNIMSGAMIVPESMIDKLISAMEQQADKGNEQYEKRETLKNAEWKNEKELIKKEFARISDLMAKEDPASERYSDLAKALYKVREIIGFDW